MLSQAGTLVDFGGAREASDSDPIVCAAREFAEETAAMFGAAASRMPFLENMDSHSIQRSNEVRVAALEFEKKLQGPGVCHTGENGYHCYLCEVEYIPIDVLNVTIGSVKDRMCRFLWIDVEAYLAEPTSFPPLFIRLDRQKAALHAILRQLLEEKRELCS